MKMTRFLVGWFLLWNPVAWADYTVTPGKPVDVGKLTSEAKRLVPKLEGMQQDGDQVTFRPLNGEGDFTAAEQTLLDQAVTQHDPTPSPRSKTVQESARNKFQDLGFTAEEIELWLRE